MDRKILLSIGLIYFILSISTFFIFSFNFLHSGYDILIYSEFLSYASIIYLFCHWVGMILIIISIYYLLSYNINHSFYFGVSGTGLMIFVVIFHLYILLKINLFLITEFFEILFVILLIFINISIFLFKYYSPTKKDEIIVKKVILDLATKYSRLEIKEVSQISKIDHISIINIVKEMIVNQEVHAYYFKSTKTIAFNQQLNINDIDELMIQYKHWEENIIGKLE